MFAEIQEFLLAAGCTEFVPCSVELKVLHEQQLKAPGNLTARSGFSSQFMNERSCSPDNYGWNDDIGRHRLTKVVIH